MIGIVSPSHPQDARPSSLNLPPYEDLGEAVERMRGTSAHQLIITNATITSSPRHKHIESQDWQIYIPPALPGPIPVNK
jgi:hypothetical protein